MKKIMALLVVFALFAGVAFGQADGIFINAWGRAALSPLVNVGAAKVNGDTPSGAEGETYAGTGVTWGGAYPRVDFRVGGDSEMVGWKVHITGEKDGFGVGDDAHIWAKPFGSDILKFTAGHFIEDTLRGKIGNLDGGFSNFVGMVEEEDAIFGRFGTAGNNQGNFGASSAFMISSAPIDGLFIGLFVPGFLFDGWGAEEITPAAKAYRYMQIGAGFNIAGIGHIRAQYIGGWAGEVDLTDPDILKYYDAGKTAQIQFAFALTAIDGLLVDLGAKIGLAEKIKFTEAETTRGMDFSVGAIFNTGIIGIGARVDAKGLGAYSRTSGTDKSENGMTMVARVVPTFALDFAKIGLDIAFGINGESKAPDGTAQGDNTTQIGFGAFLEKGLGKGSFKIGATYTLAKTNKDGKANGSDVFQIPIILEYAFF
jgi:hypothetical protein